MVPDIRVPSLGTVGQIGHAMLREPQSSMQRIPLDPRLEPERRISFPRYVGSANKYLRFLVKPLEIRQSAFPDPMLEQRWYELVELDQNNLPHCLSPNLRYRTCQPEFPSFPRDWA